VGCHNAQDLLTEQFLSATLAPSSCDARATERRVLIVALLSSTQQVLESAAFEIDP
jgi:hypothetical protein